MSKMKSFILLGKKSSFSFKPYSKGFDYCTQEAVLKKIDSTLPNATPEELSAIKTILPQYLKTHFQYTESGETEREIRVCHNILTIG